MGANDQNALNLLGEQDKDKTRATNCAHLIDYLRGLPSLDFSEKGRATICQRFSVSNDELAAVVAQQRLRPNVATPELLRIISAAITPSKGKSERGQGE